MSNDSTREDDPIRRLHRTYMESVLEGNVERIVPLYADDAVFMPHNETSVYGRDELTEWHEEYFEHFSVVEFTETERAVTIAGDWAIERWAYMVAIDPVRGGERIHDDGRFLIVWKREPGRAWKMSQVIFNSIRPIGSGTSRFMVRMLAERSG